MLGTKTNRVKHWRTSCPLVIQPMIRFPPEFCFRLQIHTAIGLIKDKYVEDKSMWKKIAKSEYRRCAVIESYESIKHILLNRIVRVNSPDHILLKTLFEDHIDRAINQRGFTMAFSLSKIPEVHKCVLDLVKKISARKKDEVLSHSFEYDESVVVYL